MRRTVINVLVALLIAIFAIGAPIPAKAADCSGGDCGAAATGMADGSCDLKGEPCKVAQNCAAQVQKMPAQASFRVASGVSKVAFAFPSNDDLSSASITPEISPPRA
jgi:hypothetical protein